MLFRESRKISDDMARGDGNVWVGKYEVITCKRGMDAWKVKIRGKSPGILISWERDDEGFAIYIYTHIFLPSCTTPSRKTRSRLVRTAYGR